jgi:hypothetical protein
MLHIRLPSGNNWEIDELTVLTFNYDGFGSVLFVGITDGEKEKIYRFSNEEFTLLLFEAEHTIINY